MYKPLLISMLLTGVVYAQAPRTTYFTDQYGMPQGSATQSGNTTYFNNQYGMPTGTAIQSGNTTYLNDSYGMPIGSSTTLPIISYPQAPAPLSPLQTLQPFGR